MALTKGTLRLSARQPACLLCCAEGSVLCVFGCILGQVLPTPDLEIHWAWQLGGLQLVGGSDGVGDCGGLASPTVS
jgi:hypothetical protein